MTERQEKQVTQCVHDDGHDWVSDYDNAIEYLTGEEVRQVDEDPVLERRDIWGEQS